MHHWRTSCSGLERGTTGDSSFVPPKRVSQESVLALDGGDVLRENAPGQDNTILGFKAPVMQDVCFLCVAMII